MIGLDARMEGALSEQPGVAALAFMDGRAGLLLGLATQGDVSREWVEVAAFAGPTLCSAPSGDEIVPCAEAFAATDDWVRAYARVPDHPELVVMGLAPHGTNVALLRSWLGEVARRFGRPS